MGAAVRRKGQRSHLENSEDRLAKPDDNPNPSVEAGRLVMPPPGLRSNGETLSARTARLGIGVGELKTARDEPVGVVEMHAAEIERTLRIDQDRRALRADDDVAAFGQFDELHLVGEPVAAASSHLDSEKSSPVIPRCERAHLGSRRLGQADEALVAFADAFG